MWKVIECIPQQQSRTATLKLHHWNLPWSWLRCREYIRSDRGKDQLTFCCLLWFRNQVFPEIIKFDVNSTQQSTCWGTSEGGDYPPYRLSVDFNFQVTSSLENAPSDEYVGLHAQSKHISPSTLGQPQTLFSPFVVIESMLESLKVIICLMRVLDDEGSRKLTIKLSNEFWSECR